MKITREQLDLLCRIAEGAGIEIMDVYENGGTSRQKDDDSPLTEADLRADRAIRAGLEEHFPGMFILSEESVSTREAASDTFFLVDPLDGTKEFLKRNDEFTVNIGLVCRGKVIAGVVLAPALGELFYAGRGLGAWKQSGQAVQAITVAEQDKKPAVARHRQPLTRQRGTGCVAGTNADGAHFFAGRQFAEVLPHRGGAS